MTESATLVPSEAAAGKAAAVATKVLPEHLLLLLLRLSLRLFLRQIGHVLAAVVSRAHVGIAEYLIGLVP